MANLMTRIANMFGIGRVTGGHNDSGTAQKIQYQTPLEVASADRLVDFGFSSGLPVDTDVVIAFIGGDRSSPVVIASGHQGYRHTGLNAGETVMYNQWAMSILLTEDGVFVDAKGKNVEVNNATNVTINASKEILANTPIFKCTGDVVDNCETNTTTLRQLRETYNDHDHDVKNVQSGDITRTSEKTKGQVE